jgi:hypothetical protein
MKKLILSCLLAVLPLSLFAATGTAIPGGSQSTPFVIDKPGAYYLAANRTMTTLTTWAAIEIKADNVTLDLNGFTLAFSSSANQSGHGNGIVVKGDNVEIRNGVVSTTPAYAIFSETGDYLRLIDLRVLESVGVMARGRSSIVDRCHVSETRGYGLQIGNGGVARNCTVAEVEKTTWGGGGIGLELGTNAVAVGCIVEYTDWVGIFASAGALIQDTRIAHSNREMSATGGGIVLEGPSVTIRHSLLSNSNGCGILIRPAAIGAVVEETVVRRSAPATPTIGAGIVCQNNSATLRNNQGVFNQGGFIVGPYVDAGGNNGS